jgi:WD40 repeat protein
MEIEQALQTANAVFLAQVGRRLNEVESVILLGSLQGQTYEQIADRSGYAVSYLKKDVSHKFWKLLGQALGEPVSKTNFRGALENQWRQSLIATTQSAVISPRIAEPELPKAAVTKADWGEGIDISTFHGRSTELETLTQWIRGDRCRLIVLLGMGGIGKTALSVKLARHLATLQERTEFDYVVWRSLRNAPPLDSEISSVVQFLSDQAETQGDLKRLMHYLRTYRCLIVLDNMETILQDGGRAGQFRVGYEDYGELLQTIGETNHQSCLMVTSREKSAEVAALEGSGLSVRSLQLSGSPQAVRGLMQMKGLVGTAEQMQILGDRYGNSPLAIKIVATSIQDLFDGDISAFLAYDTPMFNGMRRLLDQQFNRLSALEQTVMYWLGINRGWTTIQELQGDMVPVVSKAKLLEALESLNWRSLTEKQSGHYTQQPVVMEYVTERLIEGMGDELINPVSLKLFLSHALIKTTTKDYVRESQIRLILQPIAAQFQRRFSAALEQQVQHIIGALRRSVPLSGYGAGNLLNLCGCLPVDITGYDFSQLTIRHAHLQNSPLHHVNFTDCEFINSTFMQTFGAIFAVAFSPDSALLATGESSGEIRLWRVADRQLWLTLRGHGSWVRSLAFSPDGTLLVSASADQTVRLWNVETGQLIKTLHHDSSWVWAVDFSPDGHRIAMGSADHSVKLLDIHSGEILQRFEGHTDQVWSVKFSPDGTTLVSGSHDYRIKLWHVATGKLMSTLEGHTDHVWSVSVDPSGVILASASADRTVMLWDSRTGSILQTLRGHLDSVLTVSFSPDGLMIASGSADKTIKVWEIATGTLLNTLQGHGNQIWSIRFSPDGRTIASGSDDQQVKLWDVATGQILRTWQGYTNWVRSLSFSPDGLMLASGSADHQIRVWDVQQQQLVKTLRGHANQVWSVKFSPDGRMLASGSHDHQVKLWDVQTGKLLNRSMGHDSWIWSVAWSPDGSLLASCSADLTVKIWQVLTGKILRTIQGHEGWVWSVRFSPDGQYVATGSADQTIKLWDILTGETVQTFVGHTRPVWVVCFSPDGKWLASGSDDQTVNLWDVQTGERVRTLRGHTHWVRSLSFNAAGDLLASSAADHTIRLWDVETGNCVRVLEGHRNWVLSVAFSPESSMLASSGADETIRLWDGSTGECQQILRSDRPYEGMKITGVQGISEAQKATLAVLGAVL